MSDTQELSVATVDRKDKNQLTKLFNLTPRNLTEAVEFSKLMAATELVPKQFLGKPQTVLIAVQMGVELGFSALQAVNSIAVINGRATMWGDGVLAVVVRAGVLDHDFGTGGYLERDPSEALKLKEGRFEIKRKGWKETMVRTFTMDDAVRAGLVARSGDSGPWKTYPGRMLQMRARSWALRDACPDVLRGLKVREEEEDVSLLKDGVTGERIEGDQITMPRRKIVEGETVKAGAADAILRGGAVPPEGPKPELLKQAATRTEPHEPDPPAMQVYRGQIGTVTIQKGNDGKNGKPKSNDRYALVGVGDGNTFYTFSKTSAELAKKVKTDGGTGEDLVVEWWNTEFGRTTDKDHVRLASDVDAPGDEGPVE